MLERPKSTAAAREQLFAASHAIGVAAMVIRSHQELLDAFADPTKRARLLAPMDASEARAVEQMLAPVFAMARGFIAEYDARVSAAERALNQVKDGAAA